MENFAKAFVRNPDGTWFCRAPVQFIGAHGPATTTPGVTYRRGGGVYGYDIAQWLDDWERHGKGPIHIQFL
jgi:hypothetical protein